MPELQKTLQYLYGLQLFGIKAGLNNISELSRALGHPEKRFPCVHIAGTNGKGSTASMMAAMLTASGYRTGLYTSPHLVRFNERIRINGRPIPDEDLVRYTHALKPQLQRLKATFFEATTAIAFQYFADRKVDIAVIETGLGGRWDATNIVTPLLSIITNIGLDHTEYLGSTHSKIAYEKGGIIKRGIPCITAATEPSALRRLKRIARQKGSELIHIDRASSAAIEVSSITGIECSYCSDHTGRIRLRVSLAGEHQARNLRLAMLGVEYLKHSSGFARITSDGIRRGLRDVQRYSGFRGRLDLLRRNPFIIGDVAHNPAGIKALVEALQALIVGKCIAVFGVMKDKDYGSMIESLSRISRLTIAVRPKTDRALPASAIVNEFHSGRREAIDGGEVSPGLRMAMAEAREREPILVVGSHYVVGEAMESLEITV